jgi:acetolactate synthase-1/2/3 large subunit
MGIDSENVHTIHAGRLIARRLRASGIDTMFTLSGGHLFSIYDGCRSEGIRLIDTRHEQTAAFAAEGWSKVTRVPGVAALTAGPGITNGMSAMAAAQQNQSPLLVLGGRAPALRWGMGSLQEIDHVPFVAPLCRYAATAESAAAVGDRVDDALRAAVGAPSGVGFVDFPMDHVFGEAHDRGEPGALTERIPGPAADGAALQRAIDLLAPSPSGCGSRCSPTVWRAGSSGPTMTWHSRGPGRPRSPRPTWPSWSASRWISGSASAPRSALTPN